MDDDSSKGCGIVEFASAAEAAQAIVQFNNTHLDGREIHVREDREAKGVGVAGGGGGRVGGGGSGGGGGGDDASGVPSWMKYLTKAAAIAAGVGNNNLHHLNLHQTHKT